MINAFYGSWPETPLLSVIAYINCHFYGLIMNHGVMVTVVRCRWSVHITLCHVVALVWSYQWGYRGWWHPSSGVNILHFFSNELRIHLTLTLSVSCALVAGETIGNMLIPMSDVSVGRKYSPSRPIWAEILMTRMTSIFGTMWGPPVMFVVL